MNGLPPYHDQNLSQLTALLQWQGQKLTELENKMKQLQTDMERLSRQKPMMVEKIEYKFDQLKIEKLEGTLHIGVSPGGDKSIDDLSVDGKQMEPVTTQQSDMFKSIHRRVDQYLANECPLYLRGLEEKYQFILGHDYRDVIVQDIRGQVDGRIQSYMNSAGKDADKDPNEIEQRIFEKIKSDIQVAIDKHMQSRKDKRKE